MHHTIAVEEQIDRQISHIRDMMNLSGQSVCALPGRQILQIRNARYHTAGYLPNRAATPTSQSYIVFQGEPTPSSQATGGILRFVPDEEMQVPVYDASRKTIQLWVDWFYVPMVMEQLKHRRHFLWIGCFDNGQAFADLYSDP